MYGNYLNPPGPSYVNQAAEAEVRKAFVEAQTTSKTRVETIQKMTDVLAAQMRKGTFLSRHMRSCGHPA